MAGTRQTTSRTETLRKVDTTRKVAASSPGAVSPDDLALNNRIVQGTSTLSDGALYFTKDATSRRVVKFAEPSDDERPGLTNVAQAKTGKNQDFFVGALQLLGATSTVDINDDPTTLAGLNYGSIAAIKGLQHGELTIRHNGKTVLDRMPLTRFYASDNDRNNPVGEVTLDNIIRISPQQPIEAYIDFGHNTPNRIALKLLMVGTQTLPA